MYSQLVSDTGLPLGLNGTQLCAQIENSSFSSCAVGAQFDLNFQSASGTIDTCDSNQGQILRFFTQVWPVTGPFTLSGHSYSVPLDPSGGNSPGFSNGTFIWQNYT